ncbi:hypothetical protein Lal_00037540 [Lupinus albus]|nr:hypothetical protein Lal_00037540 [Lupinus albus]
MLKRLCKPCFHDMVAMNRLETGYVRYIDVSLLVGQGFRFPHQLEVQGINTLIELNGKLYPSLNRECYTNF